MEETICQNRHRTYHAERLPITHSTEGLSDTHRGVRLIVIAFGIHERLQVLPLGGVFLACDRFSYEAHI
jgi:hypothetical protein